MCITESQIQARYLDNVTVYALTNAIALFPYKLISLTSSFYCRIMSHFQPSAEIISAPFWFVGRRKCEEWRKETFRV